MTNNGTLTITKYTGPGGDVIIPDTIEGLPVTSIGSDAFYLYPGITSVTIPDSVTNLEASAFHECSLISVTIPASVSIIGESAFKFCNNLTMVTIPEGVTIISDSVLYGCTSLTNVVIPDSVVSLGDWAFSQCTLTRVTIPTNVISIGNSTFSFCGGLTSVTLPNSVTRIGNNAFEHCGLTSVTLPNSITNIGDGVFSDCVSLASVTISSNMTSTGNSTFSGCSSLTSVSIPTNVTSIGNATFSACSSLNSLTIPFSVTNIGGSAFYYCTNLVSLAIPTNVISIGDSAFRGCKSLISVTIPSGVSSIGQNVFGDCTSLAAITVDPFNSVYSSVDGILFNKSQTTLIRCPGARAGTYTIPSNVTYIEYTAFSYCSGLTAITIPSGVTMIANAAFYYCNHLAGAYFNGNAPSLLGSQVFEGDNSATVYYLPGTTGWGTTFGGRPAVLWNPEVKTDIVTWGAGATNANVSPNYGQRILPTTATNLIGIAGGGFHSLGLTYGGRVVAWGWNMYGQTNVASTATNIISIAGGDRHSLALRSNGTMVAWGNNTYGQTAIPSSATNVTAIAAGWYHNLAITNGRVVAWGAGTTVGSSPDFGQSIVPSSLSNVVAVAGGGYHSLALRTDGTIVGWGWNASGQTNIPTGLSNVTAIAAGGSNSLALKTDGTVVGWGDDTFGQTNIPMDLTNIVAIAAGGNSCLALSSTGNLVAWGESSVGQTNVAVGLTNIVAIAAGRFHGMALTNDGSLLLLSQPGSFTVTNGANVQFKCSSFGPPPVFYQWRKNETNLDGATAVALLLTNVQYGDEGEYSVFVSNLTDTTTSSNGLLNIFDLGEALNAVALVWTNGGGVSWLPETYDTHDGVAAAVCGPLVNGQPSSAIGTTVTGPGTLTFWWRITSPYASLRFYVDGIMRNSLTTGTVWVQRTYHLDPGIHALSWTAVNTWPSSSTGTAYLDQVSFTADPLPLRFDVSGLANSSTGFTLSLTGLSGHGPVIIYASSNLLDWNPILTNPPQIGSLQFLDASATNRPAQYYRAQEQ